MKKQFVLLTVASLLAAGSMHAAIEHPDLEAARARHRALRRARYEREQTEYLGRQRTHAGDPTRSVKIGDQSKRTQLEAEREARASTSRNEHDERIALERAGKRRAKAANAYAFFNLSREASAREILDIEDGEDLDRGLLTKKRRARLEAWHQARYHDNDDEERKAVLEVLLDAEEELHKEIGLIKD